MSINWERTLNILEYPYMADRTGVVPCGAIINKALSDLGGAGTIEIPEGTYALETGIVISSDNVHIVGDGYNTILKPISGANFDVISTPIPGSAGLAGFVFNYIAIENMLIDGSNMSGSVAGQGNLVHWYGVRYSNIHRVFFNKSPNWAILLDGDNTGPGNNFSYDNYITECIFDLSNGNLRCSNSEANQVRSNQFKWCGASCVAAQPALGVQITTSNHMRMDSGYMTIVNNVVGNGGTTAQPQILLSNNGPCRVIGNRSDQPRKQFITLNGGNHIVVGNQVGSFATQGGVPGIQIGSSGNLVAFNEFDITAGATGGTYNIAESGGPFTGNRIIGNDVRNAGLSGTISLNATSTDTVTNNAGYNPVGHITSPSIPATTVDYVNNFGSDATVYIIGGTVSVIATGVPGSTVATGLTSSAAGITVRVQKGQAINLTYTVVPTSWSWYLD